VLVLFALGLMAKPMLVTVPFVLLLLDYWPLGRMDGRVRACTHAETLPSPTGSRVRASTHPTPLWLLIVEKLPLLALTAASCGATLWAQRQALEDAQHVLLPARITNALVSPVAYLGQLFYPAGLAVFYPHPGIGLATWKPLAASLVLVVISLGVLAGWRKYPWLLMGWFWYLVMLAPVSGVIQVGSQAMADRYTYLPQIGLVLALAWTVAIVFSRTISNVALCRWACGLGATVVLAILAACAWRQTTFWCDSESMWRRSLACTSGNHFAHWALGTAMMDQDRIEEAIAQYKAAIRVNPTSSDAHNNLGIALRRLGRIDEAVAEYQAAIKAKQGDAQARNNLGVVLEQAGRRDEAIAQYEAAIKTRPDFVEPRLNLGTILESLGRKEEALAHFQKAVEIDPKYPSARRNLGIILYRRGRTAEALAQWREALRLTPDDFLLMNQMARIRATNPEASLRNGAEAVSLAEPAVKLAEQAAKSTGEKAALAQQKWPHLLDTLAAAYAENGQWPQAVQAAQAAAAEAQGNGPLAEALRTRIPLYQSRTPYREPPQTQ
jgi:protein O-mannosyl-transferase